MIYVTRAAVEHIPLVADAMRPRDVLELLEGWNMTPEQTMRVGIEQSQVSFTLWADDMPLIMFGVQDAGHGAGYIWLVSTKHIEQHRFGFARASRVIRTELLSRWAKLINIVDCSREEVVRWARWLGAEIEPGEGFQMFTVAA